MHVRDSSRLIEICFGPAAADAAWVQFDIGLVRAAGDARPSARVLFDRILPWWEREAAAGRVSQWFFMRKPPDVRLRVLARPDAELDALARTLAADVAAGRLASLARGAYLAETARFGGPAALAKVHGLFTLDSVLWRARDRLVAARAAIPDDATWLAAVLDNLFTTLGITDGWARLARHVLLEAGTSDAPRVPPALDLLAESPAWDPGLCAIAEGYRTGHAGLARQLRAISASCPLAEIAAMAAFFSFNRHGFAGERSRPLVAAVLAGRAAAEAR